MVETYVQYSPPLPGKPHHTFHINGPMTETVLQWFKDRISRAGYRVLPDPKQVDGANSDFAVIRMRGEGMPLKMELGIIYVRLKEDLPSVKTKVWTILGDKV